MIKKSVAINTTITYLIFGILWILLSDIILFNLPLPDFVKNQIALMKGFIFVLLSSLIIYNFIRVSIQKQFESQQQFQSLVNSMDDVVFTLDNEQRHTGVYGRWMQKSGFKPEMFLGKSAVDIFGPDAGAIHAEANRKALAGEKVVYEWSAPSTEGIQYTQTSLSPLYNSENEITGIVGIGRDITDRRNFEEVLKESEGKYRTLIEISNDAIFINEDNAITYLNSAGLRLFGASKLNEVIGRSPLDFFHPSYHEAIKTRINEMLIHGNKVPMIEEKIIRFDGSIVDVEVLATPFTYRGKKAIQVVLRDISQRKLFEMALLKLSKALDQSPVSVIITDTNGLIEYVNPKFSQVSGYSIDEVIGKNPKILQSGNTPESVYKELWSLISTGSEWRGELQNRKKDGTLYWEYASISPIRDEKGVIVNYVGVKEDISDRKILEDQIIQLQKMESIGTLASGIAHDFNNILSAIVGNASMIENQPNDVAKVLQRVERIVKSTERGSQLVRQLMTMARKTKLERKSIKINDLIHEVAKLLDETIPKTIKIMLDLQSNIPLIDADPNQLHQVFLNLCFNARDAMPAGGMITIITRTVSGSDLQKRMPAAKSKQYVSIIVKDTGEGIDELVRQKIFDPFFTTKEIGKGTGLGLAVVLGIVTKHKGFVDVNSEAGSGSEFAIYLPLFDQIEAVPETARLTIDELPGGNETILLIEDEVQIRETAVEFLEGKGYTVLSAGNGEEGVELFKKFSGQISLVLSDFGLPKYDGEEVYRQISALKSKIPFILLTGFIEPEKKRELLKLGMSVILLKPVPPVDILLTIRKILNEK